MSVTDVKGISLQTKIHYADGKRCSCTNVCLCKISRNTGSVTDAAGLALLSAAVKNKRRVMVVTLDIMMPCSYRMKCEHLPLCT